MKKILLSGIKPTGAAHIGNYFGAMKQFVDLQNSGDYQCYFMIADYHGLNFIQNKDEMRRLIINLTLDYLAVGIDPRTSVLFKQSDVSAHTELAWIFDTLVTMPYLMRSHAFKDAEARSKEISVGTFNYPVLMAADILLYDTDVVPVGQDQKQHIEYSRDIAEKFNHIYGKGISAGVEPIFKLPEPLILASVATVPGTDGRKMSKSYNNTIELFATREEITKAVMSIVTDSNGPPSAPGGGGESGGIPANVHAIHRLFKSESDLSPLYEANKGKYKVLKEALIEDVDAFIKPMRERRAQLVMDEEIVKEILKEGGMRAHLVAGKKLNIVKEAIGVA